LKKRKNNTSKRGRKPNFLEERGEEAKESARGDKNKGKKGEEKGGGAAVPVGIVVNIGREVC